MIYLAAYVCSLIVFCALDAVWIGTLGQKLYRPLLGDILVPAPRIAPAIVFYLLYPVGIVVFVVLPGLRESPGASVLLHGMLFGAIAYGTYDLTNQATLRTWSVKITLLDMGFGALASGLAAIVASYAARYLAH